MGIKLHFLNFEIEERRQSNMIHFFRKFSFEMITENLFAFYWLVMICLW